VGIVSTKFVIHGRRSLQGRYPVQGNKNAALPILAACLLADGPVVLRRVPRIRDVGSMLGLLEGLGVKAEWRGDDLAVDPRGIGADVDLPDRLVESLRGAILLLGPLATRSDRFSCALPGGCHIGRRSFDAHWPVFHAAGFEVGEASSRIEVRRRSRGERPSVFLHEASVTATENALLLFAGLGGGRIENPAREPHVLALIDFLRCLGARVETHPLYYDVQASVGAEPATEAELTFTVPGDYIDAGTLAIASAVTDGDVVLEGISHLDLVGIRPFLERFGVRFEDLDELSVRVTGHDRVSPRQLTAGPWPLFPTDLISLAIVLAVQGRGLCLVHDWMYEARMFFVDKLARMGARITLCDPHRVLVEGSGRLKGITLESPDIRAGMALIVAGLCAEGTTVIEHGEVVQRGYERVAERLRAIGADVVEEEEK
jgi:UDP-N-acetylglucosamine 1-carboxyvinyltransferase